MELPWLRTRDIKSERDSPPKDVISLLGSPGQRALMGTESFFDSTTYREGESWRYSIADHFADGVNVIDRELVSLGEGL